jgi:hypothetical protein
MTRSSDSGPCRSCTGQRSRCRPHATSPLNIASTATERGSPSRTVFDLRLCRLTSTLAAVRCGRREGDRLVAGSQAKLYLTDPVLAWLPSRRAAGSARFCSWKRIHFSLYDN